MGATPFWQTRARWSLRQQQTAAAREASLAARHARRDCASAPSSCSSKARGWKIHEDISALKAADDAGLPAKAYALALATQGDELPCTKGPDRFTASP